MKSGVTDQDGTFHEDRNASQRFLDSGVKVSIAILMSAMDRLVNDCTMQDYRFIQATIWIADSVIHIS